MQLYLRVTFPDVAVSLSMSITTAIHVTKELRRNSYAVILHSEVVYLNVQTTEEITDADINPEFIHVQTLVRGQVFVRMHSDMNFGLDLLCCLDLKLFSQIVERHNNWFIMSTSRALQPNAFLVDPT
jgi:hypothetical protein